MEINILADNSYQNQIVNIDHPNGIANIQNINRIIDQSRPNKLTMTPSSHHLNTNTITGFHKNNLNN